MERILGVRPVQRTIELVTMTSSAASANYTEPLYSSAVWIALQSSATFFTISQTYILICLLLYEWKRRKRMSTSLKGKQPKNCGKKNTKFKNTVWLDRLATAACAWGLLKCSVEEIDLFLGTKNPAACQAYAYLTICGYGGCLFHIMLFLWLRQASVQSHPKLKALAGTKMRIIISRILLVLLILTFVVLVSLNFATITVIPSPLGCVFADQGTVSQSARSSSGLVFTVFFQPALALLLLYPLLKKMPKTAENCKAMPVESKIRRVLKRTLVILGVIVVTDIITIIASYMLQTKPCVYLSSVYDANCLFGVLSLVLAQANWRERLLPCRNFENKVESNSHAETPAQVTHC